MSTTTCCRSGRGRTYRRHDGGSTLFILGADGTLGRDEFLRLLYGARVSLEVAVLSTIGVMTIGIMMGVVAGYFRGWIDAVISRVIEVTMAFPALLFIIALAATVGERLNNITFGGSFGKGVVTLVLVFTVFGWFYPARIVRSRCSRCGRRSSWRPPGWSGRATCGSCARTCCRTWSPRSSSSPR